MYDSCTHRQTLKAAAVVCTGEAHEINMYVCSLRRRSWLCTAFAAFASGVAAFDIPAQLLPPCARNADVSMQVGRPRNSGRRTCQCFIALRLVRNTIVALLSSEIVHPFQATEKSRQIRVPGPPRSKVAFVPVIIL